MSQTNGQHDDFLQNGPNNSFQISQASLASMSNNSSSSNDPPTEFPVPTGPPISDFLSQLSDYNTTIPGKFLILKGEICQITLISFQIQ